MPYTDIIKIDQVMISIILQNSLAREAGYSIGYILGVLFPFVIIAVIIFFIIKPLKNKSKNRE